MYVAMARHLENTELRYIADTPTLSLDQVKAIRVRSKLGTVSPAREVRGDCIGQLTACAPPFNAIVRLWQSSQKADHATRTCPNSMQMRSANFMSCTLEERVALILLELSENFGVRDRQGVRLTVTARHKDLAELVGASRPRVTEYLSLFEREHMILRDGRQLVVKRERLENFLAQRHSSAGGHQFADALAS
jgi:Crp-like helix-turn-helix domain